MTARSLFAALLAAGLLTCAGCGSTPPGARPTEAPDAGRDGAGRGVVPEVVADAALPRIPLAQFAASLPGRVGGELGDDHGIALGGIGSDLYPATSPDEYWMITDRGPNGQVKVDGEKRRTFPVPGFDPTILRVRVDGAAPRIEQAIPIVTRSGRPVTGLPNTAGRDETPYDLTGRQELADNPSGLDTEGLVRTGNGEFWASEEYSPSLLRISPTGTVLARYVPEGLALPAADYPVYPLLPAILANRTTNRGFESLAISPDGRMLYAALQSPLELPDADAGGRSRALRLLAVDTVSGRPTAEYVYRLDDVTRFDPDADGDQSEMKVSGLAWYGPDQLLVDERTDAVTKLYVARLSGATNVLGGPFDDRTHSPPLETATLSAVSVTPLAKTLLVDLTASVPDAPKKVEGIAVRDQHTIAVANDNDFGMTDGSEAFGPDGRLRDSGARSRLLVLRLP
jgi:hypothetical protein